MTATGFFGGILDRSGANDRCSQSGSAFVGPDDWWCVGDDAELFLRVRGESSRVYDRDNVALLLRGYVARPSGAVPADQARRFADQVLVHYQRYGELPADGPEGSYTLALLDARAGRVLLYRNLVGAGSTYYCPVPGGFLFSGNLADLVDASGTTPRPNRAVLPLFFLYRSTPGPDTLFDGFQRLLPGEQVTWESARLEREQRRTFADLADDEPIHHRAVERLEATMREVLVDCAAWRPGAANLLSGGVDSSYLQAVWNQAARPAEPMPASFSVSVDHPHTWEDTDYAMTAAEALSTRHTLVPADAPYASYLIDSLARTGEPPNHVQSAYFGTLARAMAGRGIDAGLCGEGADSLFGLGTANQIHNAGLLRRLMPLRAGRAVGAAVAAALGRGRLAYTFRLANLIGDETDLEHPVNRVASFADWDAVEACFGHASVRDAAARRRTLLDRYAVPSRSQDRLHAMGYLAEAVDSACLWVTLFNDAGIDLLCPFLDSRVLRFALNLAPAVRFPFRRPKDLLKKALARHVPRSMAYRRKLGFGQPIFEWLAPGGQLRPLVDGLGAHDFVSAAVLDRAKARPGWFLYSLVCYDLWHRLFLERSLPRAANPDDRAWTKSRSVTRLRAS